MRHNAESAIGVLAIGMVMGKFDGGRGNHQHNAQQHEEGSPRAKGKRAWAAGRHLDSS